MGLLDLIFGRRAADDEGILDETEKHSPKHPHPGARGEDLAGDLHRLAEERRGRSGGDTEEGKQYDVPQRYERAGQRLRSRLEGVSPEVLPGGQRQARKVERYLESLGEAGSRQEARQTFSRAFHGGSRGKLHKLERKLEGAEGSLYRQYEAGEISRGKFLRGRRGLERSLGDLKKLGRWR